MVAVLLGVVLVVEVVYVDTQAEALLDGVVERSPEDQCRGVLQTTAPFGLLSSYACSEPRADIGVVAEPVVLPALADVATREAELQAFARGEVEAEGDVLIAHILDRRPVAGGGELHLRVEEERSVGISLQ